MTFRFVPKLCIIISILTFASSATFRAPTSSASFLLRMLQAAKEAAEIAEVVNELLDYIKFLAMDEVIAREEVESIDLNLLSPDEYVKHKPDTLDEAIERACRHKIEEAKKLFHTDYEGREAKISTKLVELEVKSGVTPPKSPPPPAGGA